ncbi:MAG: hypothetical protein K2F74_05800, partial [Muribaculaceae bacterium]|nr:hypothetical protein [Muribaculaceae bacterium]
IDGYTKDECVPISVDSTRQPVVWNGKKTLENLDGSVIRLRFHLTDGDLYSFWISDKESGESRGYTAGGGPGLNKSGIDE